jgi:Family of unknown function (DUF5519)
MQQTVQQQDSIMVDHDKLFEDLRSWILHLPGVTQATHRFGGTEFQVEGVEFMHHHGPSLLDIRLSKNDQEMALKNGTAIPHRFAPQAGWVSFRIDKTEDLDRAEELIKLAYENARTSLETARTRRSQQKLT